MADLEELDDSLFSDPNVELRSVQFRQDRAIVASMTREGYRNAIFHNLKVPSADNKFFKVGLRDLLDLYSETKPEPRPMHFIFHGAFCCSTLLARCLDQMKSAFVLREPQALNDLVKAKLGAWFGYDKREILECVLALVSRNYGPGETTFVKPSDGCNYLIEDILAIRPSAGALFLQSPLDGFICQTLKDPRRAMRVWNACQSRVHPRSGVPELDAVDPLALSPARAAAYFWLLHRVRCRQAMARVHDPTRTASLDYREFLRDPKGVIRAWLALCGVEAAEDEIARATSQEVMGANAKNRSRPYTPEKHFEDLEKLQRQLGIEIRDAKLWIAQAKLDEHAAPLGRPLKLHRSVESA